MLEDIQIVENDRKNIAAFEQLVKVYNELIKGESSGLSQLQLDQVESQPPGGPAARSSRDRLTYRNDLDSSRCRWACRPTSRWSSTAA